MDVKVTTSGIKALHRKVSERRDAMKRVPAEMMRSMADDVLAQFRRNVESFTPGRVPDLTEKYKKQKNRRFGHVYPILMASGQMISSMFRRVYQRQTGWLISVGFRGQRGKVSNADIAGFHIQGSGNNPVRDFFTLPSGFSTKWRRRILEATRKA